MKPACEGSGGEITSENDDMSLPGEHSQIAKLQKPNRFIPPSAPRSPSARPLTTHPDSYRVNPQAATV